VSARTRIEWTDTTWNPVTGCTKVSPGCKNCYAERMTERFGRQKFTDIVLHPDRLDAPLRWRKPRRVFVNSMSDLFHEAIPDSFIDRVFAAMALAQRHTFQVLTKRAARMHEYFKRGPCGLFESINDAAREISGRDDIAVLPTQKHGMVPTRWPLPTVWLGVSCEDQERAGERIPLLLQTPAAVRFVSAEPLLGPIDFDSTCEGDPCESNFLTGISGQRIYDGKKCALDWIIVGGESGPGARPMNLAWARSIVEQCRAAGVPCFVKQLGARPFDTDYNGALRRDKVVSVAAKRAPIAQGFTRVTRMDRCGCEAESGLYRYHRLHDHKGGDPSEWPEEMRVREYP
jgi:protein gp37